MRVTLIAATFNDLVHGTFNDKKTGCGIELLKPEIALRYKRIGEMKHLGDITCEKCKAKIAKEMIKADSMEMKALLKKEKERQNAQPKTAVLDSIEDVLSQFGDNSLKERKAAEAAKAQPMNAQDAIGKIVTMPQIIGYSENGQPIYSYVQMIIQGYDQNGFPVLMPLVSQAQPRNTRLQDALNAAMETPLSENEMTIGQKIAAANAAKPVSANVSKIATNEHSKSASRAFINAISESKDAKLSLNENQGLQPKTAVPDSVADVLAQLGDNSFKEQIAAANAAKPVSANVSKIATNEHSKSASQAFINAISESKDAKLSLAKTQELQQKTDVPDSTEDVFLYLDNDSYK